MPRNPDAPRASEVHWLSEDEKQLALAEIPEGQSFSNFIRQQIFNLPALQHGGHKKGEQMIPESVLILCEKKGAQWKAMARNYRAAQSKTHRLKIAESLQAIFTPDMWLAYYQEHPKES